MIRPFSASRLRQSTSFRRLTGVSAATFEGMVEQLRAPWDAAQRRKAKTGRIEALAKPAFAVRREPKVTRRAAEALIVDCTEQPIQRPGCDARQRAHYSGKKRRHTVKAELVVTPDGRIASVSASHPGSRHDLTIRREGPRLPRRARLYADSACQGYDREQPDLEMPYKKPKGGVSAEEEKEYNRGLGSFRVRIEHRIGRAKRFRIASDRFRNPLHTHNTKFSIVAGLVNLEAGFPAC